MTFSANASSPTRPPEWGRLTWLRNRVARAIAGDVARIAGPPAFTCTIVKLDHIGDFVLATGAIHRLVEHFGAGRCALVISHETGPLAAREFPGITRRVLPAAALGLFRDIAPHVRHWKTALAAVSCEHLVCLRHQRSLYRDLVLRSIPARHCWWIDETPYSDRAILELGPAAARYPLADAEEPTELAAHRQLLSALLRREVTASEIAPVLRPAQVPTPQAVVVVAPFAHQKLRDLPTPLAWAAISGCSALADAAVVMIGSANQRARLEALCAAAPAVIRQRCSVVAGAAVERWIEIIADARLVLAADSASAHIAAALDRPLVATLGGGHPGVFAPWRRSQRQKWLRHRVACYGCDWHCPYPEPYCLTQITPEAMLAAMQTVLAETTLSQ